MKTNIYKFIFLLLFIITAVVAYQTGLSTGFSRGYVYQSVSSSPLEGIENVFVLKALREKDIEKAIEILENTLDSNIIFYQAGINDNDLSIPYPLKFPDARNTEKKIMIQIAKYRKEHPSLSKNIEFKKTIDRALNYYHAE